MIEDQFIDANSIRTRYWSAGNGGVPLLLLHGLSGSIEDWSGTVAPLAKNRRVIAIDLLGSGRTEKPRGCTYSPDQMRDHVLATLDALGLDIVDLVGWSLGGRIALDLAHAAPDRLRRLILTAPAGIGPDTMLNLNAPWYVIIGHAITRPIASGLRIFSNALRSGGSKRLLEFTARRLMYGLYPPSRRAFVQQLQSFVGPSGFLEEPRQQLLQKLPLIHTPTLAIWGRQDNFASFAHSAMLIDQMPNCRLRTIERCGHTPHIEWPEIYINAVNTFLK